MRMWPRDSDWTIWDYRATYVALTIIGLLMIWQWGVGPVEWFPGRIVQHVYVPARTGVGVGPNMSGNGGMSVVVVPQSTQWVTLIQLDAGGDPVEFENKSMYLKTKDGDRVRLSYRKILGLYTLTGAEWGGDT